MEEWRDMEHTLTKTEINEILDILVIKYKILDLNGKVEFLNYIRNIFNDYMKAKKMK